jgi:methylated-DNA-[protein]-cysteine S-methyltransferase
MTATAGKRERDVEREAEDLLARLSSNTATPTPELRVRLAERADDAGLLDVAYAVVDSPVGQLLIATTAQGLLRVAFEREGHDAVLARLCDAISPRILRSPRRTDTVARQLDEYFERRRREFDLPLDLRLVTGFRRTVITHLSAIAYGATATYAAVAAAAGNPTAVRAAASACSHNPVPLVVPCHRVVRSDGTIGNYLGGTEAKAALLTLERAA